MKFKFILMIILLSFFAVSCVPVEEAVQKEAVEEKSDLELCEELDLMNEDLASLYEDLTLAEEELDGLKIDLDYAKEDGSDTSQLESLIKEQEDYMADLNFMITDLQKVIENC